VPWRRLRGAAQLVALASVLAACAQPERAGMVPIAPPSSRVAAAALPPDIEQAINQAEERAAPSLASGIAGYASFELRQEYGVAITANEVDRRRGFVRTSRLRLRDRAATREQWLRRTHVFVQETGGSWRLASAEDTVIYDGAPLSDSLHSRYGGTFAIAPGKTVRLAWQGGMLLATMPDGSTRQVFLASPLEEAPGRADDGHLRFTLSDDGRPATVAWVRQGREVWRATRSQPE
jgi:hypothetical protein